MPDREDDRRVLADDGPAARSAGPEIAVSRPVPVGDRRRRDPRDDRRLPARAGGRQVALYERACDLGGLVGSFDFDGHRVDRFYHVILPTDDRVIGLARSSGSRTRSASGRRVGFYGDDSLFSMTTPKEFLKFPILRPVERARLAAFVARCQLIKSYEELDDVPLARLADRCAAAGRRASLEAAARLEVRRPLRRSSGDVHLGAHKRMSKTRDAGGHEVMGWLEGGYQTLIDALARRSVSSAARCTPRPCRRVRGTGAGVTGLVVDGSFRPFDHVLCTLAPPVARS